MSLRHHPCTPCDDTQVVPTSPFAEAQDSDEKGDELEFDEKGEDEGDDENPDREVDP